MEKGQQCRGKRVVVVHCTAIPWNGKRNVCSMFSESTVLHPSESADIYLTDSSVHILASQLQWAIKNQLLCNNNYISCTTSTLTVMMHVHQNQLLDRQTETTSGFLIHHTENRQPTHQQQCQQQQQHPLTAVRSIRTNSNSPNSSGRHSINL